MEEMWIAYMSDLELSSKEDTIIERFIHLYFLVNGKTYRLLSDYMHRWGASRFFNNEESSLRLWSLQHRGGK